ncbi:TrmH family RNA methyltransferase [Blattabacterium cuenoti]|uniref:TrmH family RNA methyltransferase n=1 Tax=Blattabacterium cuenoti TaxID=1653831 RepID=UPI00163D025A|nr:TrmH family RNA methyltransferase [Blattabacterium cuenoti]
MIYKKIYSINNTKIKNLKKKIKRNFFIVEGLREFNMAIKGGFSPLEIFICKNIFSKFGIIKKYNNIYIIKKKIFKKLAYRDNYDGIITLFKEKKINKIKDVNYNKINKNIFILVLDGLEKPGNIGAILRVAESIKFCLVILCNIKTYIFNSNVIRCSLGSVFTNNIVIDNVDSIINWIKKNEIQIFVSGFNNKSENLYNIDFSFHKKISIVIGSENKGVSKIWINNCNKIINIPMFGNIDSLNVSNAMSIISYEIIRQKIYKKI